MNLLDTRRKNKIDIIEGYCKINNLNALERGIIEAVIIKRKLQTIPILIKELESKYIKAEKLKSEDNTKPLHYGKFNIQPIELIDALNLEFDEGNIVKYISRYRYKNGLEDLKKALVYYTFMKNRLTHKPPFFGTK